MMMSVEGVIDVNPNYPCFGYTVALIELIVNRFFWLHPARFLAADFSVTVEG